MRGNIIILLVLSVAVFGISGCINQSSQLAGLNNNAINQTIHQKIATECSSNLIYCNTKCYEPCPAGYIFDCPINGNPSCVPAKKPPTTTFESYENTEPYFGLYCDKISPYDLDVRKAASDAVRRHPGSYSIDQLLDIYDWVKENIIYLSVPVTLPSTPYNPGETLATRSGDCKNQAVLIASMIESIGGTAKVVINPDCNHAYALVYFAKPGTDMNNFAQIIWNHYNNANVDVQLYTDNQGVWVIFDPAGGTYPGDTLSGCQNPVTIYYVKSCLTCSAQYPSSPYTYGDKCYSECPSGTISVNSYACVSCPVGSYSFKNRCVTCPSGYELYTDGKCYPK